MKNRYLTLTALLLAAGLMTSCGYTADKAYTSDETYKGCTESPSDASDDASDDKEATDCISVEEHGWHTDSDFFAVKKPVIYLYPEKTTDVKVHISNQDGLTTLYPTPDRQSKSSADWTVTASPDGTLHTKDNIYNYLYWEGTRDNAFDFSKGFCVRDADTAAFLDKALAKLGLTRREANEFIVYWLPEMQQNRYNIISFQTTSYTNESKLKITPKPDTVIRVFMAWKPSDTHISIPKQKLTTPSRHGFTAVEWGGSEVAAESYDDY